MIQDPFQFSYYGSLHFQGHGESLPGIQRTKQQVLLLQGTLTQPLDY